MSAAEQLLADNNVKISELIKEVQRWRDSSAGFNSIYPTITEGRQSVGDGKYFSVPGNGAYMRLYRRQGSSAELIAEFPDRDELNSVIDQLGPLLGRGVVGGGGDLMAQGAFGLGRSGYALTDFDALPTKNEFFQGQGGNATGDIPPNTNYYPGLDLARISGGITRPVRLMFNGTTGYVRTWDSSNVPSTAYLFNNLNLLGTVSQSDGVPTGAIIERGSNANGNYVKYADGTLECTRIVNLEVQATEASDSLFRSVGVSFDFPAAFVNGIAEYASASLLGSQSIQIRASGLLVKTRRGSSVLNRPDWSSTCVVASAPATSAPGELTTITLFASGRWY